MNLEKGKCALPPHLKEKKHNDWPFFLKWIPRAYNAYGARCPEGSEHYLNWPPKLVEGYGVSRWENTGASSIIEIPFFKDRTIDSSIYGHRFNAYERNEGNPNFNKIIEVELKWEKAKVWDEEMDGKFYIKCEPNDYHPSALQKFSKRGWMKLDPSYTHQWRRLKSDKPEPAINTRKGFRPDSLDGYYNKSIVYLGLNYE